MEATRRFSILPFPQLFENGALALNIVVLPRNQNPLAPAIAGSTPFADAALSFEAHLVGNLASFPNNFSAGPIVVAPVTPPANARALFEALRQQFKINEIQTISDKAPAPLTAEFPVRKYLPVSYRQAFNFTTPRTRAAVTDDSYHCAVRNAGSDPSFQRSPDEVSWGQVFAFALRQPLLAGELGMIYATSVQLDATLFKNGGWVFIDLAAASAFRQEADADPDFVKKYAARIPALKGLAKRPLFAPILFPVGFKLAAGDPDPPLEGTFDQHLIETAEYDDGFTKIVHAVQPQSRNLLAESHEEGKPVKDAGIRLGWDDEQILIWYLRQLGLDDEGKRLDAPLGVFGYAVDVRETAEPEKPWETLNKVVSRASLLVPAAPDGPIALGNFTGELPYQVYPMRLGGDPNGEFWLPMYFANWTGHSMVLPDKNAADIYQTNAPDLNPTPDPGTGVTGPATNQLNKVYKAAPHETALRYGREYDFRVRLRDLSGGGAEPNEVPAVESPSSIGRCHFKRYVAPNQPRVADLPVNIDATSNPDSLSIERPFIGYPAVVYTGKYAHPVARLKQASHDISLLPAPEREAFGIHDPDVDRIQVTVEVETLKMDNLQSVSGKENYVHLYTTMRKFPPVAGEDDYATALQVPLRYRDVNVMHTGDELDLAGDFGFAGNIDNQAEIFVPTARNVRLTLRAVCEGKADDAAYYGLLNEGDHEADSRYGHIVELHLYRPSTDERDLFVDTAPAQRLQAIYLQPDLPRIADGKITTLFFTVEVPQLPDIVQRLAKQLELENTGLTLVPKKGERAQFGCSSRIRHTLAPDRSSLTFSSKGDLPNHWLCCLQLTIDRDWTWDGLDGLSFVVTRTVRFTHDAAEEAETSVVGEIEVKRTASFESLHDPQRNYTRIVFIDAVEPKNHRMQPTNPKEPRFPDTIEVSYAIATNFREPHGPDKKDADEELTISLPITTPPAQVPKIASAGLALSPYVRNDKYSASEPRRRFLWIEFAEPVKDPKDTYFARFLAYAPDQLISNSRPELLVAREEPPLQSIRSRFE